MREPIPTWYFVLVVVRRGDEFLLVHERKHGQSWYLPAGRVELGETFEEAAVRETFEEAGVRVVVDGLIRIDHTPHPLGGSRLRVVFHATPADDAPPKSLPDEHSLKAEWVTLERLHQYPLRSSEVEALFRHVAQGGTVHPHTLIRRED